jgi:hypothetical protein
MRLVIPTLLLLILAVFAFAAPVEVSETASGVRFQCHAQAVDNPAWTETTVALPADAAELTIRSMTVARYNADGSLLNRDDAIDPDRVVLAHHFTMRELHGFTVRTEMRRDVDGGYELLESADFDLTPTSYIIPPQSISEAFLPSYRAMISNFNTSYLRDLPYSQPFLLIIGHTGLESSLAPFIQWKRQLGYRVELLNMEDLGSTSNDIRQHIQTYYASCDNPPDYLLLIGDTNGSFTFPSFFVTTEYNVTDLPYSLMDDNDYLPEMICGRFSCDSALDLLNQISKTYYYESQPYMEDPSWFTRALVVAGNMSSAPPLPTTPVLMSRWLTEEMYDVGFTEVDTVFYPPTYPGTGQILNSLVEGVEFVSYRGWGAAEGWHFPEFHSPSLASAHSYWKMPIVTSIVCNTGDFNNEGQDPNFGETWMRMGSTTQPDGCVAFTGPSDLHTSTEFNNNIAGGFYQGVFRENIRGFGDAVLRGKTELYKDYPLNVSDNVNAKTVNFYYHVYNVLCDPSLRMWLLQPGVLYPQIPSSVPRGASSLDILLPEHDGTVVTASRDLVNFTRAVVQNGIAILPIDASQTGSLTVTVSRPSYKPVQVTVPITAGDNVGVSACTFGDIVSGGSTAMNVTATNYSANALDNVTATLSSDSPYFTAPTAGFSFGSIAAGGSASNSQSFGVTDNCPEGETMILSLTFSTGRVAKYLVTVSSMVVQATTTTVDGDGVLAPGETANITVTVQNVGSFALTDLTGTLVSSTTAATVNTATASFGSVAIGATANATFNVTAAAAASIGREARFLLNLADASGRTAFTYASTTIGPVDHTAPTGPDQYGYFIYDSTDSSTHAPDYAWHNLDPQQGGDGQLILMRDDVSFELDLPFTFGFYGVDYNTITVCSNGWLAFGEQGYHNDFRNWNLPAALGPDALIAAYWDDLKGYATTDSTYNDIRFCYKLSPTEAIFQWNDAYSQYNNSSIEKFEVVITPISGQDGEIQINYNIIDNPDDDDNFATVGIENVNHTKWLKYTYANQYPATATPLANYLALLITTTAPDNIVGIGDQPSVPARYALEQNAPNPFNPETRIRFSIAKSEPVSLRIYDVRGRLVRTLCANENLTAGSHELTWNGTDDHRAPVGSGMYFYELRSGSFTSIKKMVILK